MYVQSHSIDKLKELRLITRDDLIQGNKRLVPRIFFVRPFYSENILEEHHAHEGMNFSKWREWLVDHRLYVLKPTEEPKK